MPKLANCELCGGRTRTSAQDSEILCFPCRLKNKKKRPKKKLQARIYVNATSFFDWKEYKNEIIM